MTALLLLAVATTRWPMKQKTLPPTRNQRRPSRSVLAPLEKSACCESTAGVGYGPDHKAHRDRERPGGNEPDRLCRIAESRGNLRLNGGHDGNGPEGQAVAHGQDLSTASTPGPRQMTSGSILTPTTTHVLGVTTGSSSSTLISGCFSVSLIYSALSSEDGPLWPGSVESCMLSNKRNAQRRGVSVNA